MKRKMVALVIGNAAYGNGGALKNPVNDAEDIAAKLKSYGFDVLLAKDATNQTMDRRLKAFGGRLNKNEVGLFFFAGHGMQIEGHNYLLAVDTDMADETAAKHTSLPLDRILDTLDSSTTATKIVILDACRNNPWERVWRRSLAMRGLASVYAPKGTIIGFATSPGQTAFDGKGRNGAYTGALLQHIDAPDCAIETMFKRVRNTVAAETRDKQITWEHTSLSANFYFNMSLGQVIKDYQETSLADSLFVIDVAKPSHRIIRGLKSYNYYRQNDALAPLDASSVKKMSINNLFVLGRNIYQAACGGANEAISYVTSFMGKTTGFPPAKRKALLDGMLFEIFFDSHANLRHEIKGRYFDEMFDLQKHKALAASFDFIAETLIASRGSFYAIPGKNHDLPVTVATSKVKNSYQVEAVYIDGVNVLRAESGSKSGARAFSPRTARQLEEQLSDELIVPSRSLKVSYTPAVAAKGELAFPLGFTVRKQ